MATLLAMIFSAASLIVLSGPVRAAASVRPGPERQVILTPEESVLLRKGKIVLRELDSPRRSGRTYEALGLIQSSFEEAASVLTDFERYPDFMPSVSAVRVCERSGPLAVVEISLRLPLGIKKQYRLRYTAARDDTGFELSWEKVEWPELKPSRAIADTSGYWQVQSFKDGDLLVIYHVYTEPGHVPLGLTGLALGLAKNKIPDGILKLRERLRTVFGPGAAIRQGKPARVDME